MGEQDWALTVGVSVYPAPELGDLDGSETDAQDFHAWVTSKDGGGITSKRRAKLVLSSHFKRPFSSIVTAKPTAEAISRFFETLHAVALKSEEKGDGLVVGRRLYIYFSGHGFAPSQDETALLMANFSPNQPKHYIPGKAWANLFFGASYFEEILLFMDCCRTRLGQTIPNPPSLTLPPSPTADQVKRFFAFATGWGKISRERVMQDGKSHGVFTSALMKGLRGAAGINGEVSSLRLRSYLINNMKTFLTAEDLVNDSIPKEPVVEPPMGEAPDFLIVKTPAEEFPVRIHLPVGVTGLTVNLRLGETLNGEKFPVVRSGLAQPPLWETTLPWGLYLAEIVGGPPLVAFEVNAGQGGTDVHFT